MSCEVCHDQKWISHDVPVGSPDFGKAFPCSCVVNDHEWRAKRAQSAGLDDSMLPGGSNEATFMRFEPVDGTGIAFEKAKALADDPYGKWLGLWAANGRGKTHLLGAIVNAICASALPIKVKYWSTTDLLYRCKEGNFEAQDDLIREADTIDVLLLDEFGSQALTPWVTTTLERLLDGRWRRKQTTVFGFTALPDELEAWSRRIMSRLLDKSLCVNVIITAADYRQADARAPKLDDGSQGAAW